MHDQPDGPAGEHSDDHDKQRTRHEIDHRITIATRVSQCVAATALIAGVTIGAAATAGAE